MDIVIPIPKEILDHCAKMGLSEEKTEDIILFFLNDTLDLYSNEKLLNKFKKWELQRYGIM